MAVLEKVIDSNKIELIFTSHEEPFIPMFWTYQHDGHGQNVFSNYVNKNNAIYFWTFDHAQEARFSLHFICYLLDHLMHPVCCNPEKKVLPVHWIDNVFTTRLPAKRFSKFLLENFDEAEKIKEILNEAKKKLLPHETLHSHLDALPSIPSSSNINHCLSCQTS